MKYLIFFLFVSCFLTIFSQSSSVPFTLEDRDRNMRTEQEIKSLRNEMITKFESLETKMDTKFESLETKMDIKFESQQRQIDDIKEMFKAQNTLLYWAFSIIISIILFTLAYTIWDRRTAIKPLQREQETILKVLKDYSKKHIDLSEILKKASVL